MNNFEILPHTADVRVKAWGATRAGLLKSVLQGMFAATEPRYMEGGKDRQRRFEIKSPDFNALLIDLLNEAIALSDIQREAYQDLSFELVTETEVKGFFIGRPVTGFETQLKAATYHELEIKRREDGKWEATITFDV